MNQERRILLGLFAIALGVRILYAAIAAMSPSINPHPITSEASYGLKIASSTEWISEPYSPRSPGYPFFLGMIFFVMGAHIWPAVVVQAILGGVLVVLIYKLGKLLGGPGVGVISALWLALYVHHIHFSSLLVKDALACLVLSALVLVIARPFSKMRFSLLAGALYTYLIHIDPQYLLILPVFAVFILVAVSRYLSLNLQYFILFISFAAVLSLPWTIRNYAVYKQLIPVSLESNRYIRPVKEKIPAKVRAVAQGRAPAVSKSRFERIKKNSIEFWRVTKFGHQEGSKSAGQADAPWSLRHNLISIVSFGLLLPFFLIGMISTIVKRNRAGILLTSVTIYYFIMRMFFGGSERTRLQIEPFIIVLALYGVFRLLELLRRSAQNESSFQ